jgi:nitric oxide reductase large subunit
VSKYYDPISRTLGKLHFPVVFVAAAMLDIAIEAFVISGFGVYAYHQAPQYLFLGVVWSNTWLLGGLLTASYFGLAHVQKWTAIPKGAGFALASETTWKGVLMAAGAILTSAFLLGVLQLFWWSATHPWIESGRQF